MKPCAALSPRAARSRAKILEAATEILVESGARSVTVDAVAEVSGVAKSTMYRHWPSRNDLLIDVVRSNIPVVEPPDPTLPFEAALRQLAHSAAAAFSDPHWVRIFAAITALRTSLPDLETFIEADRAAKHETLGAILDAGVAEGALSERIEVEDAVHLLVGPLVFAATTCTTDGLAPGHLTRLADLVVDRFIAASCNGPSTQG